MRLPPFGYPASGTKYNSVVQFSLGIRGGSRAFISSFTDFRAVNGQFINRYIRR